MKKNLVSRVFSVLAGVILSFVVLLPVQSFADNNIKSATAAEFTEKTELSAELAGYIGEAVASAKNHGDSSDSLLGSDSYLSSASSTATDWMALAMGRFGYYDNNGVYRFVIDDSTGYEDYLDAMRNYIETKYSENGGKLHSAKSTEWHRAIVTIEALGGDPTNFGTYNGQPIDLVADGTYNCVISPGYQGINGWIWGLIALDSDYFTVPEDAVYTREDFIEEILKAQLTDGGWALGGFGGSSDADITSMVIQALAPYYFDDTVYSYTDINSNKTLSKTVRECVNEALDRLGLMISDGSGLSSWGTANSECVAQVITALCSLGIDPVEDRRFITDDGKTLLDLLLEFRLPDGGFSHIKDSAWNSMANDQATYALVSYWRYENGMMALYDMRPAQTDEVIDKITAAVSAIDKLSETSDNDIKSESEKALTLFKTVPFPDRRYVTNYPILADLLEQTGGEEIPGTDAPYIESIELSHAPDKTDYIEGELFDPSGMEVNAVYSDGSREKLSGYDYFPTGALSAENTEIIISYGELRISVPITVRKRETPTGGQPQDPGGSAGFESEKVENTEPASGQVTEQKKSDEESIRKDSPDTGDNAPLAIYLPVLTAFSALSLFLGRKKQHK